MAADPELFDPQFLGQLRSLFFRLRKRRQLKQRGIQPTPSSGFTREFKDHRQYTPGDDYRVIDWRMFARLEKLFIRLFEEVQEYHVHVIVDNSRSMVDPYPEKRFTALRLAAGLSYLALVNQHRVSMMTLGDMVVRQMPPLKGEGHIHEILKVLSGVDFEGVTNLDGAIKRFRPARDRKGIVFLVSDLFGHDPAAAEEALRQIRTWPAETHVIHVLSQEEVEPNLEGEIRLVDVETNEVRRMWLTKRDLDKYRETFDQFIEHTRTVCMRNQIDYLMWTTDQPFDQMFINLLSRGSALAGS